MDPDHNVLRLNNMPPDMLTLIVAKVGISSSKDYVNARLSCKELNIGFENYFVAKDLSLQPLVQKPRQAKYYKSLMESCLRRDNMDAHYVQGIVEYFVKNEIYIGLHHLRAAAKRGHKEARFIYGVLLMSLGTTEKGKKFLTKLKDEHGGATLETIWGTIRTSLKGIDLHMKKVYHQSQANMAPEINCHPYAPKPACPNCFHRYFLTEFVTLMVGQKPTV